MVKIIGSPEERRETEERTLRLKGLVQKFFEDRDKKVLVMRIGSENISVVRFSIPGRINPLFEIHVPSNLIKVYNPLYFDLAREIAEVYEKGNPGCEFLIRENYASFYALLPISENAGQPRQAHLI